MSNHNSRKVWSNILAVQPSFFILDRPIRNPCKYCGQKHLDYVCDAQVEHYKTKVHGITPEKKVCQSCGNPIKYCTCSDIEKECINC